MFQTEECEEYETRIEKGYCQPCWIAHWIPLVEDQAFLCLRHHSATFCCRFGTGDGVTEKDCLMFMLTDARC